MEAINYAYIVMFFFGIYFLLLFIMLYLRNRKSFYDYPKAKEFLPITIIIPVYNEGKEIHNTLQSVVDMEYPEGKKHIVVVDDCSTDDSYEIIKKFAKNHPNMKVVKTPENTGNAAGSKNYGLKFAKTILVGFVDSDSSPSKDSLIKMVGYFEEDDKVAAVTSKVLVKNKKNFLEKYQAFDYAVIAWGRKVLDYIDSVYVTNGPLSIYRRDIIEEFGGFDAKNLTEDIEITWNILSRGYKTKMAYATNVYTVVPNNIRQWIRQRTRWNVGGIQTISKYKKYFFKGENLFGYFVLGYVTLSFILAIVGLLLSLRWITLRLILYLKTVPLLFSGYNPFQFFEIDIVFTFLMIFGIMFLVLALFYYRFAVKDAELKSKNILTMFIYAFAYRTLYVIPLVQSLFKYLKGDVKWYTK
jgi:cellulose synthase/poly-beta-1,6-N-acetylglucosamine synthase-like glycosyltransferase